MHRGAFSHGRVKMLNLLTDASTILELGAAALLLMALYLSVRLRRIEALIAQKSEAIGSVDPALVSPASLLPESPARTQAPALLQSNPSDAKFEAVFKRLDSISSTLAIIVAGERPLVVTQLMAWSFEETIAEIRREDLGKDGNGNSTVFRFLEGEGAEHTKLLMELVERCEPIATATFKMPADLAQLPSAIASCGFHMALDGHFLIGSVVAILAHAKMRQLDRRVGEVQDQLEFLIEARTGDHDAALRTLWEAARDQCRRPTEPGARRKMRHIAEELSTKRFAWIHEFGQTFIAAARTMYEGAKGEESATRWGVPACRATAERLVIAITLDYFVRIALEEPRDWLVSRLNDEASHLKGVIKRCSREWRLNRPTKTKWNRADRIRQHITISQAMDQIRAYSRVLAMLANSSESSQSDRCREQNSTPPGLLHEPQASTLPAPGQVH
jgi:hypothetical protein